MSFLQEQFQVRQDYECRPPQSSLDEERLCTIAGRVFLSSEAWLKAYTQPAKGQVGGRSRRTSIARHTLRAVIEDTQKLTGCEIERAYVDKGYRGHEAPNPRRVFISGQKRGVFGAIKRELRRRSAIEPVIGHMKAEGHLGRCYLKGRAGDAANTILSAVGYNLRLVLA
jgi:hypothetical protein